MAIDAVKEYFKKFGIESKIQEFETSSATVELAAQAVREPARIAKSLSFKIDERGILIITAGDAKIENEKQEARFHVKAKMLQQKMK